MAVAVLATVAAAAVPAGSLAVLDNGLGRTPAMGWNSWNTFGCDIDEALHSLHPATGPARDWGDVADQWRGPRPR